MKRILISVAGLAAIFTTLAPASAQAQELRPIMVQNDCGSAIRLWIRHADGWQNWHSHGSFNFSGYERAHYLTDNGVRLSQRSDHKMYFYAEAVDGSGTWEGSFSTTVNGYVLPMREAKYSVRNAAYHILLTC